MKTAYIDCIGGASGDMLLGALLDAGLPLEALQTELAKLHLADFQLSATRTPKGAFMATKAVVEARDDAPERRLRDLCAIVEGSDLSVAVKERAVRVFTRICTVEAGIHGMDLHEVHLHEVGGVDAIVDVTGVLAAFELLGVGRVVVSPLPMGRGFIHGAHGRIPLPAPATLGLLKGAPMYGLPVAAELVTPTGAALLMELADSWGSLPAMTLQATGYGAGTRDLPIPNLLRILLGEATEGQPWISETVTELETHLDSDTGETLGHAAQCLLEAGALDVLMVPAQMKKGRPGQVMKVLARPEDADRLEQILFHETSTLGIRRADTRRDALPRQAETVVTRFGPIAVKLATEADGTRRAAPEYEDCRRAAALYGVALQKVMHEAAHAAAHKFGLPH